MWYTLFALALAAEPDSDSESTPPARPETQEETDLLDELPSEEIDVYALPNVAKARDKLVQQLRADGYHRSIRHEDYTVYRHDIPYHPTVVIHDDGWIEIKRAPVRIHAPGRAFASDGSKLEYLKCVVMPTACISVGGLLVSPARYNAMVEDVYESTRSEVIALNNAVAAGATRYRADHVIPSLMAGIWEDPDLTPAERRRQIFLFWDSRTDTPEGEEVRRAVENFIVGVVQSSPNPFTRSELDTYNASRTAPRPLVIPVKS